MPFSLLRYAHRWLQTCNTPVHRTVTVHINDWGRWVCRAKWTPLLTRYSFVIYYLCTYVHIYNSFSQITHIRTKLQLRTYNATLALFGHFSKATFPKGCVAIAISEGVNSVDCVWFATQNKVAGWMLHKPTSMGQCRHFERCVSQHEYIRT